MIVLLDQNKRILGKHWRATVLVSVISLLLIATSCGTKPFNDESSVTTYIEQPGDVFHYETNMEFSYSNGEVNPLIIKSMKTYSQAKSLPRHYGYTGAIASPYIFCEETSDGIAMNYEYYAYDGTVIINDNLDYFMRVDTQTINGNEEPVKVNPGDSYTYVKESIIYDSQSSEEIGIIVYNGEYHAADSVTVTVPAGTFNCMRIDFQTIMRINIRGINDVLNMKGSSWYNVVDGIHVQTTGLIDMTKNEFDLTAKVDTGVFLTDYELADGSDIRPLDSEDGHSAENTLEVLVSCITR